MTVWVVKGGRVGEMEEFALQQGVAVIDFGLERSVTDFADRAALHDQVPASAANQLWRFAHEMREGDMVVLPRKQPKVVAVGWVSGGYTFRPDLTETGQHTRPVDWRASDIPRSNFDQDLLFSMGAAQTVSQPRAGDAEDRIERVVNTYLAGSPPAEPSVGADGADERAFDSNLDEQIQDRIVRRIQRKFTGNKLEYLVASILKASGYSTLETRPGPDSGIDIVAGNGKMGFGEPGLCVQVKSGRTPVDRPTYQQLQGNIGNFGAGHGLLVSLGDFTAAVRRANEQSFFEIRLWGPYELVQRLLETYDDLPQDVRADIPLQDRKVLVEPES